MRILIPIIFLFSTVFSMSEHPTPLRPENIIVVVEPPPRAPERMRHHENDPSPEATPEERGCREVHSNKIKAMLIASVTTIITSLVTALVMKKCP